MPLGGHGYPGRAVAVLALLVDVRVGAEVFPCCETATLRRRST